MEILMALIMMGLAIFYGFVIFNSKDSYRDDPNYIKTLQMHKQNLG